MMMQEFKKRTEKFLPQELIEDYADSFEPAYMAAGGVDKDDFCAVLKDERVCNIITALSAELRSRAEQIKGCTETIRKYRADLAAAEARHTDQLAEEQGKVELLFKQLSLVQSLCDRALATKAC